MLDSLEKIRSSKLNRDISKNSLGDCDNLAVAQTGTLLLAVQELAKQQCSITK